MSFVSQSLGVPVGHRTMGTRRSPGCPCARCGKLMPVFRLRSPGLHRILDVRAREVVMGLGRHLLCRLRVRAGMIKRAAGR